MTPTPIDPAASAWLFLSEIRTEAWGRDMPTVRLANLIAGEESALDEPVTEPGTSGDGKVDAMRAAHAHVHVLSAAHVYAAVDRAEIAAKAERDHTRALATSFKTEEQNTAYEAAHAAWLATLDPLRDARAALIRAARELEPQESKFDVVGAP